MLAESPGQWTANQLLSQLNEARGRFQAEWTALGANNLTLNGLQSRIKQIQDPARRAVAQRGLDVWAARQVRLQNDFITAYGRYHAAYNAAAAFMRAVGLNAPPDSGLAGMGAVPTMILVPAAIVAVVVTAIAWASWMHENNMTQQKGLALQSDALNDLKDKKISSADFQAVTARIAQTVTPPRPPGGDLAGMVVPALALVALIVLGPQIMRILPSRRAA